MTVAPDPKQLKTMLQSLDPLTFKKSGGSALLYLHDLKRRGRAGTLKAFVCRKDLEICGMLPPSTEPCQRHHLLMISPELADCLLSSPYLSRWGSWVLAYAPKNRPAAPVFALNE